MSVQPSGESYVCHVAEAPKAHSQPQSQQRGLDCAASVADAYRFPTSNATGANRYATPRVETSGSPGEYPTEALHGDDGGAITTAVLLAAETRAPAGHPDIVPHSKKNTAAVADPFISETSMAGDEAATPSKPYSPTVGGAPVDRTSAFGSSARSTEGMPRRLSAPLEDRVRGYSLMQPSSLAVSQQQVSDSAAPHPSSNSTTLQGGWEEKGSASEYPVECAPLPPPQQQQQQQMLPPIARNAMTGLPHDHVTLEEASTGASSEEGSAANAQRGRVAAGRSQADSGALLPTERPDGSSLATSSHAEGDAAMKDLMSRADCTSLGFDFREALQSVDFAAVLQEYHGTAAVESKDFQDCRHLFRVIAKTKDAVSAEDVYDLLVLFTPCGVAFHEGVDFLWENCEHKLSLSFENFLQYGSRLRARLWGYELFNQLSDTERILVTHRRVLPNVPLGEVNEARVRLLQLAGEQLEGAVRPGSRPLRLYEELFLVEYQEMLCEAALIPASEVPRRVAVGDFTHEQNRTLSRISVPALQKAGTDWRAGGGEADYGDEDHYVAAYSGTTAASGQVSPMHRNANQGTGGMQLTTTQQQGRAGVMSQSKRNAASSRKATTCYDAYNTGGPRSGRNGESLVVSLQSRPKTETRKNLGRFVEDEYWERRTLDDHLIAQLQTMYSNK